MNNVEQLGHNGRHAAEMARAEFAAQFVLQMRRLDIETLFYIRIQLFFIRREHDGNTLACQFVGILLQSARIFVEIFALSELQAVDKNTDHNVIGTFFCFAHQRKMTFVQIAHGRHKCHFSGSFAPLAQFFNRMNDLHGLKNPLSFPPFHQRKSRADYTLLFIKKAV